MLFPLFFFFLSFNSCRILESTKCVELKRKQFPKFESNANCEQYVLGLNLYSHFHVVARFAIFWVADYVALIHIKLISYFSPDPPFAQTFEWKHYQSKWFFFHSNAKCRSIIIIMNRQNKKCYRQYTFIISTKICYLCRVFFFLFHPYVFRWRRYNAFIIMA